MLLAICSIFFPLSTLLLLNTQNFMKYVFIFSFLLIPLGILSILYRYLQQKMLPCYNKKKKVRVMGISKQIGPHPKGKKNSITDVPGVKVGHVTLSGDGIETGVTAVIPKENIFREKLVAASHVVNGFAKPQGLIQIDELGTLEAPILLTNTLAVGTTLTASVKYMLAHNPEIGSTTGTVNCPVLECNDMTFNNIRHLAIQEEDVLEAINKAGETCEEGAIGAGRGMRCHQLKGGIGTASRLITFDRTYTLGALVLSNHAKLKELMVEGHAIESLLKTPTSLDPDEEEQGSIVIILATDLPLTSRQLKRVCKRALAGISRTGATSGNGSGEIALAFSTANIIPHDTKEILNLQTLPNEQMDPIFSATINTIHEAILSSLLHAESMTDREGIHVKSLHDILKEFPQFYEYIC